MGPADRENLAVVYQKREVRVCTASKCAKCMKGSQSRSRECCATRECGQATPASIFHAPRMSLYSLDDFRSWKRYHLDWYERRRVKRGLWQG
ncbi:hypothetical protein AZE42_09952 [Rhizopogon vesiculosus]|uniref:Uncharacterized protein n=1 Tax=Rhizopogon vesiculosus TaxID=180088 RepID=A0A1J8QLA6_9AGAM|nr:hypothetical protein AZE42_09952 [Rhizopogon vesiculosus]